VLGDLYDVFDEVHANDLVFDKKGSLRHIRGTAYDFEGKAEFIKGVIGRQEVSPLEVLFVGNSVNDVWASRSGAATLCVNPHFTNPNDVRHWSYCVRSMKDLREILPFVGGLGRKRPRGTSAKKRQRRKKAT
jgi:phosphoglycolate phosphatase-like HAD superfamily hydrolase